MVFVVFTKSKSLCRTLSKKPHLHPVPICKLATLLLVTTRPSDRTRPPDHLTRPPDHPTCDKTLRTLGAKSNKRCDRLNIFKKITVQKNPIVLTGCERFSDITFSPNQSQGFCMVIVCTGTHHQRRIGEIFVELSFQCSSLFLSFSFSLTLSLTHSLSLPPCLSFSLSLSLSLSHTHTHIL